MKPREKQFGTWNKRHVIKKLIKEKGTSEDHFEKSRLNLLEGMAYSGTGHVYNLSALLDMVGSNLVEGAD